jgi:hypothetical protein
MSPRWLHWPAIVSAADFTASGTTDVLDGIGGSRDDDPSTNPFESDLSYITIRGTDNASPRLFLNFANSTARNTFAAAYPNGSSANVIISGTTYTASSISWNNFSTFALLSSDQFDSWPANVPVGTSYTFEIFI